MSDDDVAVVRVMTQTTYTKEEAREKLLKFNGDVRNVVRDFTGLPLITAGTQNKSKLSRNQEMFRQYRELCYGKERIQYIEKVMEGKNESEGTEHNKTA